MRSRRSRRKAVRRVRPRVTGPRALGLGIEGPQREALNTLVLAGTKTATTSLFAEYLARRERVERVGEELALIGDEGRPVTLVRVTSVRIAGFHEVTWAHAHAEGEGLADLDDWRDVHRRYWERDGTRVGPGTPVVCLGFQVSRRPGP